MRYHDWLNTVPKEISGDLLWKMKVYRLSLFLSDLAWKDIKVISKNKIMISLCDQLYRATGSICANIEEGYSKKSNFDRARYFEYALGSARESRGWYYRARHNFDREIYKNRLALLTDIIKLLLRMIPAERKRKKN